MTRWKLSGATPKLAVLAVLVMRAAVHCVPWPIFTVGIFTIFFPMRALNCIIRSLFSMPSVKGTEKRSVA